VQKPKEAEANDDFAKSLGLESMEQLRGLLKGQVEQELNGLTRTHMKRKLLDQLAAAHDFPVPTSMVEAEFQQIWAQLEHEASHEADPEAARAEMEGEREEYRAIAVRRVRLGLLLSEIGQANGIDISQQEMNGLIAQAAQQYRPADREKFIQYVRNEPMAAAQLRAPLFEDKVVDFLFARAEITDRTVTRPELEAEIEGEEGHVHGPGCGHDHSHDAAPAPKAKKAKGKKSEAAPAEEAPAAEAAPEEEAKPAKKPRAKKAAAAEAPAEAPAAEAAPAEKPAKKAPAKRAKKEA
jgi:trigger factor